MKSRTLWIVGCIGLSLLAPLAPLVFADDPPTEPPPCNGQLPAPDSPCGSPSPCPALPVTETACNAAITVVSNRYTHECTSGGTESQWCGPVGSPLICTESFHCIMYFSPVRCFKSNMPLLDSNGLPVTSTKKERSTGSCNEDGGA